MGERRVPKRGIGELAHHRDLEHRHDLATFHAEDRAAQDLIRLSIHEDFHQTARFVHFECTGDVRHRHFRDLILQALCLGLLLSETHSAKLGIHEHCVGDEPSCRGSIAAFKQISAEYAEVVVRDVGERRSAFHISESIDARHIRFQALIHPNEPALVDGNTRRIELEPFRIGYPPDGHEQMGAGERSLTLGRAKRDL